MNKIGNRLKILRESIKVSQTKIGELVDLKQSSINRYEKGQAAAPPLSQKVTLPSPARL